jgi:hypothetical protein
MNYAMKSGKSAEEDNPHMDELDTIFGSKLFITVPRSPPTQKRTPETKKNLYSRFVRLDDNLSEDNYSDADSGLDKLEDVMCDLFDEKHQVKQDVIQKILGSDESKKSAFSNSVKP